MHEPARYARMLLEKLLRHGTKCWLVNTGWTGGQYGSGQRISITHTRTLLDAALSGALSDAEYRRDPIFGFELPEHCDGVPDNILRPEETWPDPEAYREEHVQLAALFVENFKRFRDGCPTEIAQAGPNLSH